MSLLRRLLSLCTILLILAFVSSLYLYLYQLFRGCAFPSPERDSLPAPFRLLALADPQLEGDSSLPDYEDPLLQKLWEPWRDIANAHSFTEAVSAARRCIPSTLKHTIPGLFQLYRKRLDLLGNDYYLAHIYRTLNWWTKPTHVVVLGDLLGSQWISDEEFERRSWRFWNRVFRHGKRIEDSLEEGCTSEVLGDDGAWSRRIINVAGNHDIGYAGDIDQHRMGRFEREFGKANWDVEFISFNASYTGSVQFPELRLVILNSMNLDGPVLDPDLQTQTYDFINGVISRSRPVEDRTTGTIVLTHIPLHKGSGVSVDAPSIEYYWTGRVKEQNHIGYDSGRGILEGIYGMSGNHDAPARGTGRNGIILTGHDHEGCDVYHYINGTEWKARRWYQAEHMIHDPNIPGIREVTVRSMMGAYDGNAGLLSAWFEPEIGEWRFEFANCALGVQHVWWAVHVLDMVTLLVCLASAVTFLLGKLKRSRTKDGAKATKSAQSTAFADGHETSTAIRCDGNGSAQHGISQRKKHRYVVG